MQDTEKKLAYRRNWYKKNLDYHPQWIKDHPELAKSIALKSRRRVKIEALSHYGKGGRARCSWPGCRVCDIDVLTLDHIKDDGMRRRKEGENSGMALYFNLRKNKWPKGFQTLCMNHQMKKYIEKHRRDAA